MMIAVIVCITIASLLTLTLLKQLLGRRASLEMNQNRLQADWLAEAGVERAAAKLKSDPAYSGETWDVSLESLRGETPGRVEIRISSASDENDSRIAEVTADYPADVKRSGRSTKSITIDLPIGGAS
jgi:hypothetical protein